MDTTWLIIWLVLFVILVVVEMITTAVTAIWFGGGCIGGAVAAAFGAPVWVQIIVFGLISFLLFAFVRPGVKRRFDKHRKLTGLAKYIGTRALVISEIDNLKGVGEVRIGDAEFAARSLERGMAIPEGAIVKVIDLDRDIMIVRMDDSVVHNIRARESDTRLDPGMRHY